VLSERVRLKDHIGEICFYPTTHVLFPSGSVTPVRNNVSGKPKQYCQKFRHQLYGCKIQNLKVYLVSILITSGVASPTFLGIKKFDFRRATAFCFDTVSQCTKRLDILKIWGA